MLNKVVLMGRLTKDPELRYTTGAEPVPVCNFTIAVDRNFTKSDGTRDTDFFDVTAWKQKAEFVQKYFTKGQQIAIEGRLEQRRYEKNGETRFTVSVIADNVYFTGSKKADDQHGEFDPFAA